ncbi:uncharacterized protein LOC141856108 [Brevipalpus obovatus]|uniref:uncharacterized protein LOC141856108 n=1 Tax=Brevipalpus obovatus TaxID=246614 RepID=UPI003D9E89F8
MEPTLYGVLGLPLFSSFEEINRKFRKVSLELHPDKRYLNAEKYDLRGSLEKFKQLSHIREELSDPKRKEAYDESLRKKLGIRRERVSRNNVGSSSTHEKSPSPTSFRDVPETQFTTTKADWMKSRFGFTGDEFAKRYSSSNNHDENSHPKPGPSGYQSSKYSHDNPQPEMNGYQHKEEFRKNDSRSSSEKYPQDRDSQSREDEKPKANRSQREFDLNLDEKNIRYHKNIEKLRYQVFHNGESIASQQEKILVERYLGHSHGTISANSIQISLVMRELAGLKSEEKFFSISVGISSFIDAYSVMKLSIYLII